MKLLKIKLLLFFLLLLSQLLYGQRIRLYNSEEGLPNSLINRVYQDNRGFIWIATENGVSYFDGMRFTTFRHDRNKPGSIGSDLVKVIFADSRGTCWVGTSNGLQIFDYEHNVFRDVPVQDTLLAVAGAQYISAILESPDNEKILVSMSGRGIVVFDAKTHTYDFENTAVFNNLLPTRFVGNMYFDSKGILWTFAEQGNFYKIDYHKKTINEHVWGPELKTLYHEIVVSAVSEDPVTGNLLIGTYNHGLLIYDQHLGYVRKTKGKPLLKYRIRALLAEKVTSNSRDNSIWVGTEEFGLKKFDREKEEIVTSDFQYSPIDIDHCKVHSIVQDKQGNIWVGIYQKGLMIIPKSTYGFENLLLSDQQGAQSENLACVTSIVRDLDDNLWIGTDGGGLFSYSKTGKLTRYTSQNTAIPNNAIMALALDQHGTLWISTYMGGVSRYSPGKGFHLFSDNVELKKVSCFLYDKETDKLFLGTFGHGVSVLDFNNLQLKRFPDRAFAGWVNGMCLDSRGFLWVGSSDGLRKYWLETGEEVSNNLIERIRGTRVHSIVESHDKSLWIASAEGIIHYDPETEGYVILSKRDGLPSNLVFSIQPDLNGTLWIGTGNGLSRLDPPSRRFANFYAYDGLQDNEFRVGAVFHDNDGKMYFGGISGLTSFYPDRVDSWKQSMSDIYFSRFTVFNKLMNYDETLGKKNILDRHITQAKQITLKKNQNVFSIEFAVLEYTNPQKVVYGYMLKGFDNDWQYTDPGQRSATYTNLPDGRYTFRVKAFFEGTSRDEDAVYNEINIHILPPWYKSWWAYLIYLVFTMFIIRIFLDLLLRRRLRIREKLEMEMKEVKLRMFTDMSHEIRTPLTLVINPLKTLREAETDTRRKELYNLMYRNVLRILRLINQLMDIRKIDNHQLKMHFNSTDLIFFVKDIMKSFEQLAIIRNIDFRLVSNRETFEVWIDQGNFDKVLFNVLSNAFKHTPDNGSVLITLDSYLNNRQSGLADLVSEYVELKIENTGSSIENCDLERIFDRFYQSSDDNSSGSGIGLHLARMIVRLHHGVIKASNTEDGVVFFVRIPAGNAHLSAEEISLTAKHKDLYYNIRPDEKLPEQAEYIELPEKEEDVPAQKNSKSKRSLVFVDDDADLGRYLKMELSARYNVEVCLDGKEAWKIISTTIPDAVITDLVMPEVDGLALCRKIRQNPGTNHLPVIILTSKTDEESEQKCIETGADRFLSKPISLELLKTTIDQAIQTRDMIKNKYRSNLKPDFEGIQISSPDSRLVSKVVESIRKNIENPEFSVDDLSREVGLSRVHLNRKLKENINTSPSALIKSIRLKQAAYLMINNKVNISDVAYKVGFSSHSYFSSIFKEYFGMAPSEFVLKYTDSEDKESLHKIFEE